MADNDVNDTSRIRIPSDEPSTMFVPRRARDERAIALAGHLLMAGVVLERQVKTLVRARVRT